MESGKKHIKLHTITDHDLTGQKYITLRRGREFNKFKIDNHRLDAIVILHLEHIIIQENKDRIALNIYLLI